MKGNYQQPTTLPQKFKERKR